MGEINSILKRSKFHNLITYLIKEINDDENQFESYENEIDLSYETFFNQLKKLYPETNQDNDDLFNIVVNFISIHDDIYFEIGSIVGFQLYKEFENQYQINKKSDILKIYSKQKELVSLLLDIRDDTLSLELKKAISSDKDYQQLELQILEKTSQIKSIGLTHEQLHIMDSILSICDEKNTLYGKLAYNQGILNSL